jgi:hypothetical protein
MHSDNSVLNEIMYKSFQRNEHIVTGFGLVIGFIEHLQNVNTNNYDSLTELHTPNITVTTAHIKCSQSWITVAW